MNPLELRTGIADALARRWPGRAVYPELCPDDHARPSLFVSTPEYTVVPDGPDRLKWTAMYLITSFVDLDAYSLGSGEMLATDQMQVMASLYRPIPWAGRRITPTSLKAAGIDPEDGASFVELAIEWYDIPASLLGTDGDSGGQGGPLMEHFESKILKE